MKNPVKSPQIDRLALMFAGSLLLAATAGCAASRTQTTAGNLPQDTGYGASPIGQFSPAGNPVDEREEYPDFRGRRADSATGGAGTGDDGRAARSFRQHSSAAQANTELLDIPQAPADDEQAGANSATRRSFRETLHEKMAQLKM